MSDFPMLFSPFHLKGLKLKNRITMSPMFLGYANPDGTTSPALMEHYRRMAASGASLIVVENASVNPSGLGSPFTLSVHDEGYIPGLMDLVKAIQDEGARAFLQINHAGRYAFSPEKMAPSPVETWGATPRQMAQKDIDSVVRAFKFGARVVQEAGFDGVEIHGGTGYLLVQFLSPRTNLRDDRYGGPLKNRMRFPLEVVDAVIDEVGDDFPVGYRFLADEWLPEGLHTDDTAIFAGELEKRGVAYLSVMAGTYDSFFIPEYLDKEKDEGYMTGFAAEIKGVVPKTPVITAGRIQSPETAEKIIEENRADLIGLARILFADPLWPKKAEGVVDAPIVVCEPACSLCMKRVMKGRPAYCSQWEKEKRDEIRLMGGEADDEEEAPEV